jgi:hypothetical protein
MKKFKGMRLVLAVLGLASLPGIASAAAFASSSPAAAAAREYEDEAGRLALTRQIADQYGITLADRTAEWTPDEVISVKAALDEIADRFSTIAGRDVQRIVKDLFQGTAFYRDRRYHDNIAYAIGGTVSFYDGWAEYGEAGRAFYLAHELGHVLDARTSPLQLIMGEVSDVFAHHVGAYVDGQGAYQLGRFFPMPGSPDRLRHRSDSAAEDWAESFATVLVPEFEADQRDIGLMRRGEVGRILLLWVKHASAEFRPLPRGLIEN